MNTTRHDAIPGAANPYAADRGVSASAHTHGVCWSAILAGAAGAAALSLILLILGVGLGLSSVSPWSGEGISAETFGVSTIGWLTFTQLAASGLGGYLAGRLRTRWATLHGDEVYFRDTAHGFLAWSIATLVTAGLLGSAVGTIVGGGVKAGATVAGTAVTAAAPAAAAAASEAGNGYFVDALLRKEPTAEPDAQNAAATTGEVGRILANAVSAGALAPDDAQYLGRVVAQRTSLSQAEAEKRVTDTFNRLQAKAQQTKEQAKAAADKARKVSIAASLWGFIALLIGAFVASFLATLGGRHRDQF
jgi:hypothetical protein